MSDDDSVPARDQDHENVVLDPLTPTERQIVTSIRDGKVDAEIAARLSISTAEVKARTSEILKKLALATRADLAGSSLKRILPGADPDSKTGTPKSRRPVALVFIGGMLVGAVLAIWAASLATGDDSPQSTTSPARDLTVPAPPSTGTPATVGATNPPPMGTPYAPPVAVVAGRSSYVFRGLFTIPGSSSDSLVSVDVREATAVIELNADVVLDLNTEDVRWSVHLQSDNGLSLVGGVAETGDFPQRSGCGAGTLRSHGS